MRPRLSPAFRRERWAALADGAALVSNGGMVSKGDGPDWVPMYLVTLLLVAFLVVIAAAGEAAW